MISLQTFAQAIEDGLNSNGNIKFKIFADAGQYKDAFKDRTVKERYTNGIIRAGASTVIPAQSGLIATQSVQLELTVQLPSPATDEEILKSHRAVLDTYFQTYSTQLMTDESGKKYSVSAVYSLAGTGAVEIRPHIGTSVVFTVSISYGYVEGGINSSECKYILDGHELPYITARTTRTPTAEANAYAENGGRSTSVNTAYLRGFDFEIPLLSDNAASNMILETLLGGELNEHHTLTVQIGEKTDPTTDIGEKPDPTTYVVTVGNIELNLRGIDNGSITLSLVEAAEFAGVNNG